MSAPLRFSGSAGRGSMSSVTAYRPMRICASLVRTPWNRASLAAHSPSG